MTSAVRLDGTTFAGPDGYFFGAGGGAGGEVGFGGTCTLAAVCRPRFSPKALSPDRGALGGTALLDFTALDAVDKTGLPDGFLAMSQLTLSRSARIAKTRVGYYIDWGRLSARRL